MDQPFALDGYVVTDLLGFGTTGEVWHGRHAATGDHVALKRLWEPMSPDQVTRLRREIGIHREISGGHIVGVRKIHELVEDEYVVVMQLAAGGSLGSLIGRRGRLHPSEVVTILGPLASLLADAHDRGLRHGDITPSNLVFTADGRPMFADFGLALVLGETPLEDNAFGDPAIERGTPPPPASDVFGLAAVGYAALTGVPPAPDASGRIPPIVELASWVPQPLAAAVEAGLAADPAARPGAERFASSVLRSCAAAPVRLSGPRKTAASASASAPEAKVAARRTPRLPRPLAIAAVIAGVFVCAALAGVGWAHVTSPAAAALNPQPNRTAGAPLVAPAPADDSADYTPIVNGLFAARAKAFATCDMTYLHAVYVARSIPLGVDRAALRVLCSQHDHTRGFIQHVVSVDPRTTWPTSVDLEVKASIPPYAVVNRAGRVVARRGARTQHFRVILVRRHGSWKVNSLSR